MVYRQYQGSMVSSTKRWHAWVVIPLHWGLEKKPLLAGANYNLKIAGRSESTWPTKWVRGNAKVQAAVYTLTGLTWINFISRTVVTIVTTLVSNRAAKCKRETNLYSFTTGKRVIDDVGTGLTEFQWLIPHFLHIRQNYVRNWKGKNESLFSISLNFPTLFFACSFHQFNIHLFYTLFSLGTMHSNSVSCLRCYLKFNLTFLSFLNLFQCRFLSSLNADSTILGNEKSVDETLSNNSSTLFFNASCPSALRKYEQANCISLSSCCTTCSTTKLYSRSFSV